MNTAEKLVTVVIPTYGRPIVLRRAIESVLNQTYTNIELIIVDDNDPHSNSRYETEELMLTYTEDKRIHYIKHNKNMNGSVARNTGLNSAKGFYITFLDDDDEMMPNRIHCCVDALERKNESWAACYTDYTKYKTNGRIDICGENRSGHLYLAALMRSLYIGSGSNLFLRIKSVKSIGGYDPDFRRNQDLEFLARLLEHNKLLYVPEKTLKIHYEDSRRPLGTESKLEQYNRCVEIDKFYIRKFTKRISDLPYKDQKKVFKMIALERLRYSIRYNMIIDGMKNCIKNHIGLITLFRYSAYALHRGVTGKVYGFRI